MLFIRITLVQFFCFLLGIQGMGLVRYFLLQNNRTCTGIAIWDSFRRDTRKMFQIPLGFPVRCIGDIIDQNAARIGLSDKLMMLVKISRKIFVLRVRIFLFPAEKIFVQNAPHLVRIVLCLQCNQVVVNGAVQFLRIILHCDFVHHVVILLPHDSLTFVSAGIIQLHSRNAFNFRAPLQVGVDKCNRTLDFGAGVQFLG